MKILLTGSSGYIGSSLQEKYGNKYQFVPFDVRGHPKKDVRNFSQVKKSVSGVDGVIHLAAISRPKWGFEDPHRCIETNVQGTLNVLEAVRQVNPRVWIILGSSREVFGNLRKFPGTEKSPQNPLNAYAVSKSAGEDLLKLFASNYHLRCVTLRFCGVYTGKKDIQDRIIPKLITAALRGKPLTIEGNGSKQFDYVYQTDALRGIEQAIRYIHKKPAGFYDDITLAANAPVSLHDLATLIIRMSNSKSTIVFTRDRPYDQRGFSGSYAKAKRLFGWMPTMSLEQGLGKSIKELQNKNDC